MSWDQIQHWGLQSTVALAIMVIGYLLSKLVSRGLNKAMMTARADPTLTKFLSSLIRIIILAIMTVSALEQLGIQTTSMLAIVGAAGLAIGLALKDSLSNFAAGFMLLIFRPFTVGHYIEAGGTQGTVEAIRIFSTIMRSSDNKEITVPNSRIFGGTIINYSSRPTRRIDLVMKCSYDDDLQRVKQALLDVLNADTRVLKDPAPSMGVAELGSSSIEFYVRSWVNTSDYGTVKAALLEGFKTKFDERGLTIPFPITQVYTVEQK